MDFEHERLSLRNGWVEPKLIHVGKYHRIYDIRNFKYSDVFTLKVIDQYEMDPFYSTYYFDDEVKLQTLAAENNLAPKVIDSWASNKTYYIVSQKTTSVYDLEEETARKMISQLPYMILDLHEKLDIIYGNVQTKTLGVLNDELVFNDFQIAEPSSYSTEPDKKKLDDLNKTLDVLSEWDIKAPEYFMTSYIQLTEKCYPDS